MASLEVFLPRSTLSKRSHFYLTTALIQSIPSPAHFPALLPLADSWISIAVVVDVAITYVDILIS